MRLYGMYFVCKKYITAVEEMKVESRSVNNGNIRFVSGLKRKNLVLNELAKILPLREHVRKFYEIIPVFYRDQDKCDLTNDMADRYIKAREELITAMKTVIKTYETINTNKVDSVADGFDIKLPQFEDIEQFSKCLEDLNFVIKQCPYLNQKDADIKYGTVDVGSVWLTFLIAGAAGTTLLMNLAKIVDAAVKIKSHIATMKTQEEMLRSVKMKSEIAGEVLDAFKKTKDMIVGQCVDDLQNEIRKLNDPEEQDKVSRSLEKLGFWMDKGMQIYSTIDAPDEIKDLFPKQEEASFLSDDILKLLEMKKDK